MQQTKGTLDAIVEEIRLAEYGVHYLVIYPDMITLRRIYSYYAKMQLEDNNEIVLILPYYETTEMVRNVLSGEDKYNQGSTIDVRKYEKEGSLMIIDSVKAYFRSDTDFMSFIGSLLKQAQNSGKSGVSVIADLASFYFHNGIDKLIEYEMSLPTKYDDNMKLKGYCLYHQEDFDRRLTKQQKQKLLEHHGKNLMIVS
jgi:MEDS: MEthanogen/methylotroph, DcmR Sensory domain